MSTEAEQAAGQIVPDSTTGTESTTEEGIAIKYADKFNSVGELESSYKELQSTFSKKLGGFEGSPETYTRPEGIDENDSVYNYASHWGKDNQLSDKGLSSLVEGYTNHMKTEAEAYQQAELKSLGDNAKQRVDNAHDWIKANLGEEYIDAMNSSFIGAKGIEAIEKMASLSKQTAPTSVTASPSRSYDNDTLKSMQFAKDEFGNRKMSSDPAYREKVNSYRTALLAQK